MNVLADELRWVWTVWSFFAPLQADGERIAQVLINLVGNAAKYSPPQTTIAITARQADNVLQVDVADQGPGIPAQDRAHVFEAFEQLNHESTRRTGGAGLGLAICRGLIEAHGGRIWAQARPGPGTVISFTLPIGGAQRPLDRRAG